MSSSRRAEAVAGYARVFHRAVGDEHHIASPLGAWLLLALVGAVARDVERLRPVLGCDVADAASDAHVLLRLPHPAVSVGAAVWRRAEVETPELAEWLTRIADVARTGDLPTQHEADAWAAALTLGLIDRFPLTIDGDTMVVLASALACSITWQGRFDVVPASDLRLPLSGGYDGLRSVLRDPHPLAQAIVPSGVGLVGVHAATSAHDDLVVVSVIADDGVSAADVLAVAYPIATAVATGADLDEQSLFDLPLGAAHAWTITEATEQACTADGRRERVHCLLPAWSATSTHHLLDLPGLGFDIAGDILVGLLGHDVELMRVDAAQSALARYTRIGFEAAAVTAAMAGRASMAAERDGLLRTAQLEFCRPHAAVAVARGADSAWAGLPVFSGWITTPDEPT